MSTILERRGRRPPHTNEVNPMTENRNAPPKVEQQAGTPKIKRKPEEPWWAWAGMALGAAWILQGFSDLFFMLSGINLDDLVIIPVSLLVLVALTCACAGFPPRLPKTGAESPPKSSSKPYGIIAGCTLACGAFLMMAAMMIPAIHAAREAAKAGADSGQWKQHVFDDGKFSVTTPASWQRLEDPTAVGDIYLMDKARDLHLIATVIPKVDVAVSTGTELARQRIGLIRWGVDAIETEEPTVSEVNTVPVVNVTGKTTTQGLTAAFHLRYFDYDEEWVELRSWSSPNTYSEHQKLFTRIRDSVKAIR